jgi:hypothetical protein
MFSGMFKSTLDFVKSNAVPTVLGGAYGAFYIGNSIYSLIENDPDSFQRLGSLGVGLAVIIFSIIEFKFADLNNRRTSIEVKNQNLLVSGSILDATIESKVVLTKLAKIELKNNRLHPNFCNFMAMFRGSTKQLDVVKDKSLINRNIMEKSMDNIVSLGDSLSRMNNFIYFEIILIVVSTLQWGYGDLFVCWFHGSEWGTCSY